ncbi:MAG: protein-tyrosine-phosphatase, partial [Stellaceae bacterium]
MDSEALVPFQLTICGIEELAGHCEAGVTHVLSILDPGWPEPEALSTFAVNRRLKLRFHDVIEPHPEWIVPERWDIELLLAFARDLSASHETHLLVHCHAGVSRSTAAATLVLAQTCPNWSAEDALQAVVRLRPRAWP